MFLGLSEKLEGLNLLPTQPAASSSLQSRAPSGSPLLVTGVPGFRWDDRYKRWTPGTHPEWKRPSPVSLCRQRPASLTSQHS